MGRLSVMPMTARIRFSIRPPQSLTDTGCSPGTPDSPRSNTRASTNAATLSMASLRGVPERRVGRHRPAEGGGGRAGQEQKAHVQPHLVQAVRQEGEGRRRHRNDYGREPCGAAAGNSPGHAQKRRDHDQAGLRPPEAVLSRAGGYGVVRTDDEPAAQRGDHGPVGVSENPTQAEPQPKGQRRAYI